MLMRSLGAPPRDGGVCAWTCTEYLTLMHVGGRSSDDIDNRRNRASWRAELRSPAVSNIRLGTYTELALPHGGHNSRGPHAGGPG